MDPTESQEPADYTVDPMMHVFVRDKRKLIQQREKKLQRYAAERDAEKANTGIVRQKELKVLTEDMKRQAKGLRETLNEDIEQRMDDSKRSIKTFEVTKRSLRQRGEDGKTQESEEQKRKKSSYERSHLREIFLTFEIKAEDRERDVAQIRVDHEALIASVHGERAGGGTRSSRSRREAGF